MRSYPILEDHEPAHLVCVPRALLPILCGKLNELEARTAWATDDDWRQGYTWIVALQAELMNGCVDRIIEGQDRIYRLLDNALNGTVYTFVPATNPLPPLPPDPTKPTISPAIPVVPPTTTPPLLPGLVARTQRLDNLLDNAYNGTIYAPAFTNDTGMRQRITDLLDSQNNGTNGTRKLLEDILFKLNEQGLDLDDLEPLLTAILAIL